jgi:tripartite-type tricarboxylate transporter receptor subunit TctC
MVLAQGRDISEEAAMNAQRIFALVMASLMASAVAPAAQAQTYPTQTIRIIVPAAPGGPNDFAARLSAQILQPVLGQPIVVEHRPGAGGAIATREVGKARPDGYTLLAAGGSQLTVLPALSASAGYDPVKDFAPVASFMEGAQVLVVNPSEPWKTVQDLIADARRRPGKLNWAHIGSASLPELSGELFMAKTGITMVGVPYRSGGEAVTAIMGHAVDLGFENITLLLPLVNEGKLRALAVTTRNRSVLAPDLPTMIESGIPDYDVGTFFGVVAPAGTPAGIVNRLNGAINQALRTPEMQDAMIKLGAVPKIGTPEEFAAMIAEQLHKWQALAQVANIRID